ncbi:hypothetical protein [uncultured Treponema sp.]|uniref:hypothetical protein n=1 Tax=uncultured Treponema sp. TaxID=162155 RepID=UPI002591A86A|nr:hypothetical protein [uncultured Treponema sp.]
MNYSEFPMEKKIETLLRDLSFYYIRSWYDSIPEEDSDDDIKKSHELINDKFAKTQIDSFFFTINFQPILYPAYALLMYYKYNSKFAEYVDSIYMNDEELVDDLHDYFHSELEKRINEAMEEEQETEYDEEIYYAPAAAASEDEEFKLPPAWNSDEQITVLNATIWNGLLRIDFIDVREGNNYCIKLYDNNNSLIKPPFKVTAENSSEDTNKKVIILNDFSYKLFFEDSNKRVKWNISKE